MGGYTPNFEHGTHLVNCDRCGRTYKAHEVRKEWNGLYTCIYGCWEPRHPQDFVRGLKDDPTPPFTRPQSSADTSTTDIDGNPLDNINTITQVGDADKTLTKGVDLNTQEWNLPLTANRVATLSTSAAIDGDTFTIYRTGGGAFTLDVGGLFTIPVDVNMIVNVQFLKTQWVLKDTQHIGL